MGIADNRRDTIPILDLEQLSSGGEAASDELATQLRNALETVGFFFVVNHGIAWSLVENIYEEARRLHSLPTEAKEAMTMDRMHGGYLGLGGGTSYASKIAGEIRKPNQNEAFFIHGGGYQDGNRYPGLEGFKEATADYIDSLRLLGTRLLPILAVSLDLDKDWFAPHFDIPSVTLRMSRYPAIAYADNEWGLAPHTDSSVFTFLPTNEMRGLEIRPAGQRWTEPPSVPESFLVNSGDMLKQWTNDHYLSTAHRARNLTSSDRYAVPFFYGARDDALVEAVPTTVSPENPARHEPITYGDYQKWFIDRNYASATGRQVGEAPN